MSQSIDILTPKFCRFVQGDLFKGRETDIDGNPLVVKTGPNKGQPRKDFFIAIAIPKSDPGWPDLWAKIDQAAKAGYPQFFDAQGQCTNQNFAWKYRDGDSTIPDKKGIRPCDRAGFAGNHILNFSSGFPFPVYNEDGSQPITDPNAIKRGYYIQVSGSVVDNKPSPSPGVYLNIGGVAFTAYGEEIRTGPSGQEMFGGQAPQQLPPGASATPLTPDAPPAGTNQQPGAAPVQGVQTPAPGTVPGVPQTPAGGAAPSPVQPSPGFIQPPAPTPQPAAPAPAAESKHNVNGQVFTRSQLLAAGWTEEQVNAAPLA